MYAFAFFTCHASGVYVNYTLFLYGACIVNMQYTTRLYGSSKTYVPAHACSNASI